MLADSHVSGVAIVVLLLFSLDGLLRALLGPLSRAAIYLVTAIATLDLPYSSRTLTLGDRIMLATTFSYLFNAFVSLVAALLLSRWVYGVGPLRSLSKYRTVLARRNHV